MSFVFVLPSVDLVAIGLTLLMKPPSLLAVDFELEVSYLVVKSLAIALANFSIS